MECDLRLNEAPYLARLNILHKVHFLISLSLFTFTSSFYDFSRFLLVEKALHNIGLTNQRREQFAKVVVKTYTMTSFLTLSEIIFTMND